MHRLHVGHHVMRDITAIEGHALGHLQSGFHREPVLDVDRALGPDPYEGLGHQFTQSRIIGRDRRDRLERLIRLQGSGGLLQCVGHHLDSGLDASDDIERVDAAGKQLQPLLNHRIGQDSRGRGAVARHLVGLFRHLSDDLRAHVFEPALKLDLAGDAGAVARNDGRADGHVDNRVHSPWPEGPRDRPGQFRHAAAQGQSSVILVQQHLGHGRPPMAPRQDRVCRRFLEAGRSRDGPAHRRPSDPTGCPIEERRIRRLRLLFPGNAPSTGRGTACR